MESDWHVDRASDGSIASIRLRGFELLAAPAHPTSSGAAKWDVQVFTDRVSVQPSTHELAQSMVWPFRVEPDLEVVLRGHDLMPLAANSVRTITAASSVRFAWPGRVAVSALWDRLRLTDARLALRPAAGALELTLSGGGQGGLRPTPWLVEIRDGAGPPSIEVVEYDPTWPPAFAAEKDRIQTALDDLAVAIHHGGSTAVQGLAAKPVIDMWISVKDAIGPEGIHAMGLLGYSHLGEAGLAGQDLFIKRTTPAFHVHCYQEGDPDLQRHLDFRDWLRAHPDRAAAYARLKKELARRFKSDRLAYTEAKSDFIEAALR